MPSTHLWSAAGKTRMAFNEWFADPYLRRRKFCPHYPPLKAACRSAAECRQLRRDLDKIFMIVLGRKFTRSVVGQLYRRQSLTDFFAGGRSTAEKLTRELPADASVLEFGGGIGRLAHAVAPFAKRLVSVDTNPLMKGYGPMFGDKVEFLLNHELAAESQFDVAYSVAVFFHLRFEQQSEALQYIHARLKPGGRLYLDLIIGSQTTAPQGPQNLGVTSAQDFATMAMPLFDFTPFPLGNAGFVGVRK